ncbi:MAG: ABC-type transport auxiliary lipoprotein family protein [Phenylobacterium sp.]
MRARIVIIALAAAGLSGCISLLPKSDPALLYRFDVEPAASAAAPGARPVGVLKPPTRFTAAAGGDRLLTITGDQAAYVKGARWVTPASVLFDEAVANGFDGAAGPARLVTRGEVARADMVLRLEARSFETVYDNGQKAAPQVVIRIRAVLTRTTDRALVGEQIFEQIVRAGDNRQSAIVAAYDAGVANVVHDLVAWTNSAAAAK